MKLLVTGGAGFIGSNFIRYILNKYPDYKIINLDKLSYAGNLDNLKDIENNPHYKFIRGDICDEKLVDELISGKPDSIIHFAAASHVDRSISGPQLFLETNIFGTYVLLESARKYKVDRFVYISTDETYGPLKKGTFKEDDVFNPSNPYSVSKAAADLLCRSYHTTHKLPVLIVRPSNNFGYRQHCEKLIPRFIANLLQNKKVGLFGNGLQRREWIFVLDCVAGIDTIFHKGQPGQVYNLGSGRKNEKTNLWIAKFILKELRMPESFITFIEDRPGHDVRYALDSSKIKQLGWKPKWKIEEGLKETVRWYKNNLNYWQPFIKDKFVKF